MKNIIKINFVEIFRFIMILFLFEPNLFVKFNTVNNIFIIGAFISFIYILFKIISIGRISTINILLIIYRVLLIIMTVLNGGDVLKVGYYSLIFIALFFYADYYIYHNKFKDFVKYLYWIFGIYLLINIVLYLLYPNGLYEYRLGINFLGIRTRFTEYAIAFIAFACANYSFIEKNNFKLIISILLVLFTIFVPKISTAIVGLLIIVVFLLLFKFFRIKKINYKIFFYSGMIITILVVFFRIQDYFAFIIENLLHEDISLTGRSMIWDHSYKYIFDKYFLIGHGMPIDGNFVWWRVQNWQAHNQLLQNLYESGLIGTVLFYSMFYVSFKKLKEFRNKNAQITLVLAILMFALMIMMITEIYGYYIPIYAFLLLTYNLNKLEGESYEKN